MDIKLCILDMDGTLLDPTSSSLMEREIILEHMDGREDLLSEAEGETLKKPFCYAWLHTYQGSELPSAYTEDVYLWRQAQAYLLWGVIQRNTDMEIEDFSDQMFRKATAGGQVELMEGAKGLVRHLYKNQITPVIITNSSPEKAKACAKLLDIDPEKVYGNAHKCRVTDEAPFQISGHRCYASRPEYRKRLIEVMKRHSVSHPREALVLGDIYTLDLSQPHKMGMHCALKANRLEDGFETPQGFMNYAMENGIYVVRELVEIKGIL